MSDGSIVIHNPHEYRDEWVDRCHVCAHGQREPIVVINLDGSSMPPMCLTCFRILRRVLAGYAP